MFNKISNTRYLLHKCNEKHRRIKQDFGAGLFWDGSGGGGGGGGRGSSILKIVSRLPKIAVLTVHFSFSLKPLYQKCVGISEDPISRTFFLFGTNHLSFLPLLCLLPICFFIVLHLLLLKRTHMFCSDLNSLISTMLTRNPDNSWSCCQCQYTAIRKAHVQERTP